MTHTRLDIWMPVELRASIQAQAAKEGLTVSAYVRRLLMLDMAAKKEQNQEEEK